MDSRYPCFAWPVPRYAPSSSRNCPSVATQIVLDRSAPSRKVLSGPISSNFSSPRYCPLKHVLSLHSHRKTPQCVSCSMPYTSPFCIWSILYLFGSPIPDRIHRTVSARPERVCCALRMPADKISGTLEFEYIDTGAPMVESKYVRHLTAK